MNKDVRQALLESLMHQFRTTGKLCNFLEFAWGTHSSGELYWRKTSGHKQSFTQTVRKHLFIYLRAPKARMSNIKSTFNTSLIQPQRKQKLNFKGFRHMEWRTFCLTRSSVYPTPRYRPLFSFHNNF